MMVIECSAFMRNICSLNEIFFVTLIASKECVSCLIVRLIVTSVKSLVCDRKIENNLSTTIMIMSYTLCRLSLLFRQVRFTRNGKNILACSGRNNILEISLC